MSSVMIFKKWLSVVALTLAVTLALVFPVLAQTSAGSSGGSTFSAIFGDCTFSNLQIVCTKTNGTLLTSKFLSLTGGSLTGGISTPSTLDVTSPAYGALGNTVQVSDAVMVASSTTLNSSTATFTSADVGKVASVTGCTSGGVTTSGTIISYTDSHHVVLSFSCNQAIPNYGFVNTAITTAQSGAGSYQPGDTVTAVGGTGAVASWTVESTKAMSATVHSGGGGAGYGNAQTFNVTTNSTACPSSPIVINVTSNAGGAVTTVNSVTTAGVCIASVTISAAATTSPTGGGSGGSGLTLDLIMGVNGLISANQGLYTTVPTSPVSTTTNGSGTGLTITPSSIHSGGQLSYGTDDSAAFVAAINACNAQAGSSTGINVPCVIHAPAGIYTLKANALPIFYRNGAIKGDGMKKTILYYDATLGGDGPSWSEAWVGGYTNLPQNTFTTWSNSLNAVGPMLSDLTISGDRTNASAGNAIALYDRNDQISFNNVDVENWNGRCLSIGQEKNKTQAYARESQFGYLRCFGDGTPGTPLIEINSQGSSSATDGTNELYFDNIDIFGGFSSYILVHNQGPYGSVRQVVFNRIRVEGGQDYNASGDFFGIGLTSDTGNVNTITVNHLECINVYQNSNCIKLTSSGSSTQPYNITFKDIVWIGGIPYGNGITINSGRSINISSNAFIATHQTGLTVGPTSEGVGSNLIFNWLGNIGPGTTNIDSSATADVLQNYYGITQPPLTNNTLPATTGYVDAAVTAGAATSGYGSGSITVLSAASGTYTPATGNTMIQVLGCGAGGGGGGVAAATAGASGGGSGESAIYAMAVTPGTPISYTNASGGSGGAAGNNNGATASNTTFGSITWYAGQGGNGSASGNAAAPATAGQHVTTPTTSIVELYDDKGAAGTAGGSTGGGGGIPPSFRWGSANQSGLANANAPNSTGYCAGGSAPSSTGASAYSGGNGAPSVIIVRQ